MALRKTALAGAFLAALVTAPEGASAETFVGTSNWGVVRIDSENPRAIQITPVTGLGAGEFLDGLGFRPSTGRLYALGHDFAGSKARLYTVDLASGAATPVGASFTFTAGSEESGFAFNPAPADNGPAEQIRVTNTNLENFRINPDTGVATRDTDLTLPVAALAFTNNVPGASTSTLYGMDVTTPGERHLVRVGGVNGNPSPSGGAVTIIGADWDLPVLLEVAGFDIAGSDGTAWGLQVTSGQNTNLMKIDLGTGTRTDFLELPHRVNSIARVASGPIGFSASVTSVNESAGTATITVSRAAPGDGVAQVDYATSDGSATAGTDYTAASGTLSFAPGATSASFDVPVTADGAEEGTESLGVALSSPVGAFLGRSSAVVTIDDPPAGAGAGAGGSGGAGGGSGGAGGSGPDTAPPVVLVAVRGTPRISRAFSLGFSCSEACSTRFELVAASRIAKRYGLGRRSVVVGSATARLDAAGKGTARVKLSAAARKRLKRARSVPLTLRATATDPAGNRAVDQTKLSFKR